MKIDLVVGARPNFVKAAAIVEAAKKYPDVKISLIHTGQHNGKMSDPFFEQLGLPQHLVIDCITGPRRFGHMIEMLSGYWSALKPDYVMVVGDTDSTAAGAIAAKKSGLPLIHVEAGLRCGDDNMQEEINRKLVDSISDISYTTSRESYNQLVCLENHNPSSVLFIGNVMIDTLFRFKEKALSQSAFKDFALLTLHRAENVDDEEKVQDILNAIGKINKTVLMTLHPRLNKSSYVRPSNVVGIPPQSYLSFIGLMASAKFVMTDSGGVQEETTALGVPCLTLRTNTERPETVLYGTNHVIGTHPQAIMEMAHAILSWKDNGIRPDLWDGHAADRLMADLVTR